MGQHDGEPDALPLRAALAERNLSPRHAQDLLTAFRLDVTKLRYRDWDDLLGYCRFSAMPVGRFVLDVHGESETTWTASDALCSALQVINHLQDCAADFRNLNRVYIPLETFEAARLTPEALSLPRAPLSLLSGIGELVGRTAGLLRTAAPLSSEVADTRLGLEIAVILRLAWVLTGKLQHRDPLSERVHLGAAGFAAVGILGMVQGLALRLLRPAVAAPMGNKIP